MARRTSNRRVEMIAQECRATQASERDTLPKNLGCPVHR